MGRLAEGTFVVVNTKHHGSVNGVILEDRGRDYRVLTPATGTVFTAADRRDLVAVTSPIGPHDNLAIAVEMLSWLAEAARVFYDFAGGEPPCDEDEDAWNKAERMMLEASRVAEDLKAQKR